MAGRKVVVLLRILAVNSSIWIGRERVSKQKFFFFRVVFGRGG